MTPEPASNPLAFHLAERMRADPPWEIFAERLRRYEVHFNGRIIEIVRGPLVVQGFGVRLFRSRDGQTGSGFQASTDLSDASLGDAVGVAEKIAAHSSFPAKAVELPSSPGATSSDPQIVDRALWASPIPRLEEYVAALLAPFDGVSNAVPSFGSVRATLSETSLANSAGLRAHYAHTTAALEVAVKAFGGPEGAPPGEYWVNDLVRRLDPTTAGASVPDWVRFAQDARRAKAPASGELPVVLPAEVMAGILPSVVGFRLSGQSRLRGIAPEPGSKVAAPSVVLRDDATIPWAPNTAPFDDEGTSSAAHALIDQGEVKDLLYDALHAGAFSTPSTANGLRGITFGTRDWMRFTHEPSIGPTTLDLKAGDGGSDTEIAEAAGNGLWVQQLGWASPDPISGAFGGEIRIGYAIRSGKIAEPLRGGTVGGTVLAAPGSPSLLTQIAAIGSRTTMADPFRGPTVLVRPLTVGGA